MSYLYKWYTCAWIVVYTLYINTHDWFIGFWLNEHSICVTKLELARHLRYLNIYDINKIPIPMKHYIVYDVISDKLVSTIYYTYYVVVTSFIIM